MPNDEASSIGVSLSRSKTTYRRRADIPPGVTALNLFEEASKEAYRHKWIESEKSGHDLGDAAIEDWYRNFWNKFVRERWLQHIQGEIYWPELDNNDFALLENELTDCRPQVDKIIEILEQGGENLDIVQWAIDSHEDMDCIMRILSRLDLNSHRLMSQLDQSGKEFASRLRARHRPRALVVDDDPDVRNLLRGVLEYEQFEVDEANSGEEAMEIVQSRRYDLFILDLRLPKRHGAEIAYYLRRHGVHRFIIAIGASLDEWHECDLYDCGFTHLLKKPFSLEKLSLIAREAIHDLIDD